MDIKTYLASVDETQTAFAARVETTDATISRIIKDGFKPGVALALRIEKATGGLVDASTLCPGVAKVRQAA